MKTVHQPTGCYTQLLNTVDQDQTALSVQSDLTPTLSGK